MCYFVSNIKDVLLLKGIVIILKRLKCGFGVGVKKISHTKEHKSNFKLLDENRNFI